MTSVIEAPVAPKTGPRPDAVLQVQDLKTFFFNREGVVQAVNGVSYHVGPGETLGVVGESGCGKSITALSILGLVPRPAGKIVGGQIYFDGRDLVPLSDRQMQSIRGNDISMIFQEPMSSLNPVLTIGDQVSETLVLHQKLSHREATARAMDMLDMVRIPDAKRRLDEYPHQLSGGMRQRVMIAMALACKPRVLIADEPTTALDVTIQAQILELMVTLQRETGTAIVFITHDLGVVAETCQRVVVMYAGKKVEEASVIDLFERPHHPYTVGLMRSMPGIGGETRPGGKRQPLMEIRGMVPLLHDLPPGCAFAGRCPIATDKCRQEIPPLVEYQPGHSSACWYAERAQELLHV